MTGDRAAADLALDVARAAGADDAWYTGAIAAAGGAPGARPPAARYDNSLSTALSLAAQLRPGPNPLANASTLSLLALARAENAPQPQRAQAAALAYRRGALTAVQARAILRATPAEITSALPRLRGRAAPSASRARLAGRGGAIAGLLRQAAAPADFIASARFFKDDIAALQNAPDQASALVFARAAVAAGDAALAQRLMASARQAGVAEASLAPLDAALAALAPRRSGPRGHAPAHRRRRGKSRARRSARCGDPLGAGAPADGAVLAFLPPTRRKAARAPMRRDAGACVRGRTPRHRRSRAAGGARRRRRRPRAARRGLARPRHPRAARDGLEQDARRFGAEALLAGVG